MQIIGVILHNFPAVLNEEDSDKFEENLIKDLMLKGDLSIHSTFTRTYTMASRDTACSSNVIKSLQQCH